jgi:hypothetical protein
MPTQKATAEAMAEMSYSGDKDLTMSAVRRPRIEVGPVDSSVFSQSIVSLSHFFPKVPRHHFVVPRHYFVASLFLLKSSTPFLRNGDCDCHVPLEVPIITAKHAGNQLAYNPFSMGMVAILAYAKPCGISITPIVNPARKSWMSQLGWYRGSHSMMGALSRRYRPVAEGSFGVEVRRKVVIRVVVVSVVTMEWKERARLAGE